MYGDMTPGDITHQDVTLQYTNHFKDAFRNMPKALPEHDKYKVWQMCADIVEVCLQLLLYSNPFVLQFCNSHHK